MGRGEWCFPTRACSTGQMACQWDRLIPLSLFQESVDAEGPVVEKIMSSRLVKKQVSGALCKDEDPMG